MKIEKPKRYYKRVSNGDETPLVFSYHHLPLIQKVLDFKDSDMAVIIGVPLHKAHRAMQKVTPLPERMNQGMNTFLLDRFNTSNVAWIVLGSWASDEWGTPEVITDDTEFSCRIVHRKNKFEVICESVKGFRIVDGQTGSTLDGTYGFSQVNPFLNVLDEMVKVDSSEWIEFWAKAQVARKIDLEQRIAAKAEAAAQGDLNSSKSNPNDRNKIQMSEVIANIEKEAMIGCADAKYSAGRALAMGIGLEKPDLEKAAYWLALASSEGHFQASKLLTQVKKTVFSVQMSKN